MIVSTLERVQSALSGIASRVAPGRDASGRDATPCLEIAPADVHEACRRLRDTAGFETNTFVTAIDRFPATPRSESERAAAAHGIRKIDSTSNRMNSTATR